KGAKSILNPQRVQIRIPTEEFLNVREMSFRKNISVTQMFTNAWKRQHKWRTKKQEDSLPVIKHSNMVAIIIATILTKTLPATRHSRECAFLSSLKNYTNKK